MHLSQTKRRVTYFCLSSREGSVKLLVCLLSSKLTKFCKYPVCQGPYHHAAGINIQYNALYCNVGWIRLVSYFVASDCMTKSMLFSRFIKKPLFDEKSSQVLLKFIYCEKATNFCEIFPLLLTTVYTDFTKFCGLLRIYELYFFHTLSWICKT